MMLSRKSPGSRGLLLVISGPSGVGKGTATITAYIGEDMAASCKVRVR